MSESPMHALTLTAAAEATTRIEVGPFIACTGFRNPALLAKMAATLDEVSLGRLVLGLGSGVPAMRIIVSSRANASRAELACTVLIDPS